MKKVLLVHHSPYLGGGSIGLVDLCAMLRSDFNVVACVPSSSSELARLLESERIATVTAPAPFPLFNHFSGGPPIVSRQFFSGVAASIWQSRRWRRFLIEQNADVVIMNSSVLAPLGAQVHRTGALPVCVVRETLPSSQWSVRTPVLRRLLNARFAAVLFISEFDLCAFNLSRPTVGVVRDSIRPGSLRRLGRSAASSEIGASPDDFNVLFTGGDSYIKGLDVALDALRRLSGSSGGTDICLIVAGHLSSISASGPRRLLARLLHPRLAAHINSVRDLLANPKVRARVLVVGPQSDMSACYSASDLVVFPARKAHQARPIFEAGFFDLPAVASEFAAIREFLRDGFNGLCFPSQNAQALSEALNNLRSDRSMARAMGSRNGEMARSLHDYDSERSELVQFIRDVSYTASPDARSYPRFPVRRLRFSRASRTDRGLSR